jgi:DNA-binding transcriptional MerR regulator
MRVLDVARCLGVSREWILAQEREGRIPPIPRDRNGHRRFNALDVERLQRLLFEGTSRHEQATT